METWKTIPGYEGRYEASNMGQIRSVGRVVRMGKGRGALRELPTRLRSLHLDKAGYQRITIKSADGVRHSHLVHHLVLMAFVGPKPDGMECRHLNGQPADNRLENLKWGTSSENSHDVVRHGHHQSAIKTHCKNGHEFTPENTSPQTNGGRACRTCNRERSQAFYEAHKGVRQTNNRDKTHCKRGHEFTPENTITRKDGRECRTCAKSYYQRKRQERLRDTGSQAVA